MKRSIERLYKRRGEILRKEREQGVQEATFTMKGIGYRAEIRGGELRLNIGYSHEVRWPITEGMKVEEKQMEFKVKGGQVGEFVGRIRQMRKPVKRKKK
jgi:ribosomal protein L6P/L9E